MKICFMSNLYPPFIVGGAEIVVKNVAEELVKKGHDVIVITTSPKKKTYCEKINNVTVYRINPMNIFPFFTISKQKKSIRPFYFIYDLFNIYPYVTVKKILKKEKVDIVHINNFRGFSLSIFNAVKSLNIPLIFTAHDFSLICIMSSFLNSSNEICTNPSKLCKTYVKIQKHFVDNKPDLIIAPSQFVIDKLINAGFFKNVKMKTLPLGIELHDKKVRKLYDIINIFYVGGLSRNKGVHILINSFKKLEQENVRLHIFGKGIDEDEFREMGYPDKRIIFHGFISNEKLMRLYYKANITVVPSICYDNSPMVIYESLMHGSPVIGSRIGGIPELVEEGYNGFLFEAGNVDELKGIFEKIISDTLLLKKLEDGAYESAKKYDLNKHIHNLETMYRDIQR